MSTTNEPLVIIDHAWKIRFNVDDLKQCMR